MRPEPVRAEAVRWLAEARKNDNRRYLLLDCLEAYATLDEAPAQGLRALPRTERYKGGRVPGLRAPRPAARVAQHPFSPGS